VCKSEGKHETKSKTLLKKKGILNPLDILSQNFTITPSFLPVSGSVQPEFHCSCCARNETLTVSRSFYFYFQIFQFLDLKFLNIYLYLLKSVTSNNCFLHYTFRIDQLLKIYLVLNEKED
jgi:hypothetical protein